MGTCFSKKEKSPASVAASLSLVVSSKAAAAAAAPEKSGVKTEHQINVVKKEIFVIKHRRSHSNSSDKQIQIQKLPSDLQSRTELLGFGTPVRTSSCTREEVDAILIQCGRLSRNSSANVTPSGKKNSGSKRSFDFDNEDDGETRRRESRSARSSPSPSKSGRRRTPSRERTLVTGSGRRVSRSPGRRSEIPAAGVGGVENGGTRPGKMVSVPAVTSSISGGNDQSSSVRRIAVRRDVRSPRSQSPAQIRPSPVQHPPLILSRSNSRKTDQSPHRRNPLSEIDNNHSSQKLFQSIQNLSLEGADNSMRGNKVKTNVVKQATDNSLQPKLIRSRSWSRSRDLDELVRGVIPNPNQDPSATSYASILLEDIQKFHQKSSSSNVPQCLTKACTIMDAVADMNSTTSSSIGSSDDKKLGQIKMFEVREVEVSNDLMEPSLHKYVTVRRGTLDGDMGDQESSGSNSVAGGCQQRWGSDPVEPNSVESVGWVTSKTRIRNNDLSAPLGSRRQEFQ